MSKNRVKYTLLFWQPRASFYKRSALYGVTTYCAALTTAAGALIMIEKRIAAMSDIDLSYL